MSWTESPFMIVHPSETRDAPLSGGATAAGAQKDEAAEKGAQIMIAGVIVQMVIMVLYSLVFAEFGFRYLKNAPVQRQLGFRRKGSSRSYLSMRKALVREPPSADARSSSQLWYSARCSFSSGAYTARLSCSTAGMARSSAMRRSSVRLTREPARFLLSLLGRTR